MVQYYEVNGKKYKYAFGQWYVQKEVIISNIKSTRWENSESPF